MASSLALLGTSLLISKGEDFYQFWHKNPALRFVMSIQWTGTQFYAVVFFLVA